MVTVSTGVPVRKTVFSEREISEAKVRQARHQAEGALRESEAIYRTLFEDGGEDALCAHGNCI